MRAEDIWAKSITGSRKRGESLSEHTQHVLRTFDRWRNRLPFLPEICESPRFWVRVGLAVLLHDVGKCVAGFQTMVRDGVRFGHRHEVLSTAILPLLLDTADEDFVWVCAGILAHHKNQTVVSQMYPAPAPMIDLPDGVDQLETQIDAGFIDIAKEYYSRFLRPQVRDRFDAPLIRQTTLSRAAALANIRLCLDAYASHVRKLKSLPSGDRTNVEALFLRGIVNLCDHAGSAHVELDDRSLPSKERLSERFQFGAYPLYKHQEEAARMVGHLIMIAPTGSGKTEAALLWAANQVDLERTPLFYVLPYQASLNAMHRRMVELFGDERRVTLQHSHAVESLYRLQLEKGYSRADAAQAAKRQRNLAQLHAATIRLLTPYQLLKAPFQLPGHESVGADMAGGRFVLDEIHAYEPHRLGMLMALFKRLAQRWRSRFLFMSATMPKVLSAALQSALGQVGVIGAAQSTIERFRRHRLHLLKDHLLSAEVMTSISRDFSEGKAVLVVATTVRRAQEAEAMLSDFAPQVLHGKFCARDRFKKEREIGESVGRNLTVSERRPMLLIATQVIEVSLDLDFDLIYSDPAPLEALIQRFGRVNRGMRYPETPVCVCTEVPEGCPVYSQEMIEATLVALADLNGSVLDDRVLQERLDRIYSGAVSDWWKREVSTAMMTFERDVLSSWRAFESMDDIRDLFDRMFDGEEVLPEALEPEYRRIVEDLPFEAPSLMVPVSTGQRHILQRKGKLQDVKIAGRTVSIACVPYDDRKGLQLYERSNESV